MNVMYFGFVALLSACGLRFVDCAPSFTSTPNNPVYELQGNDVILSWFYNPDGETLDQIDWSFNSKKIATKTAAGAISISAAYTNRVEVSGSATIKLKNIQAKDSGNYECRVTFDTFDWIVNQVELIVVVAPQITLPTSEPITIDEGNTRTLLCVASGNPKPVITWYRGSTKVQEDPNNSNYTITSASKNHAGTYKCVAAVMGTGLSINPAEYTVAVTVRFKPQHRVDSLQSNQTEVEKRNAEFYCRLEAIPTDITYRWFKGGSQIFDSGDYTISTISNGERLTVKQVKKSSAGQYSCDGQNTLGIGERKSAYLLVNYAPQQVTVTPNPAVVKLTQSITLTCDADGFPKPSYSWKFNGKLNGIRQNTLTLTNADVNDAGNYTCVAKNDFGSKETIRLVNVEYRPTVTTFTTGTSGNSAVQGTTVTLTCSANGYPAPTYTIKRGNTPMTGNDGKHVIPNIQLSAEADTYSCEPQNSEGTGPTEQLQITVLVPPSFSSQLPTIKTTKTENETVSYSCTVQAKPAATIQWILNGQNLTLGTPPYSISSSVAPIPNSKLLKTLDYLTVNRVTWRQQGNFSCLAFNNAGKKSQTTELEVRYRPVVQFSADHPQNLTLAEGATATFFCKTIGNPVTQSHKWQFNGVDIPGESCSGCSTTTFTKASVTQSDAEWYSCTGTNTLGEGPPARAQLLIKHSSSIVSLRNMTVEKGQTVTLFCNVSGMPTPSVSWTHVSTGKKRFNKTWVITDIKVDDLGQYRCEASNIYGNDSKSTFIYLEGNECSEECTNGKTCRRFGKFLCLCPRGKKGTNCKENDAIANIVIVSLKISNKGWIQEFEDLNNPETQAFAGEIKDSISEELNGTGITDVKVTKLRKGSVIADSELTFSEAVGESELESVLSEAIKDGSLGQLQVEEIRVGTTILEPAKVNKDVIYGTVIGVLSLMFIIFIIYITLKRRKRREDNRHNVMAVGTRGAQLNEGMEIERSNENVNRTGHHGAGHYMALVEVSMSQGSLRTSTETSPYLEINEYAPLHPGTRSWEVPRDNVIIEKIIGKGAFGQVAQGKASHLRGTEETMTVAIKMLKENATEMERKDLLSELEVMKKLKPHPHVIKLLGCVTESDPLLVIIEYVPYGDLLGYLRKSRGLNDTYFKDPDVKPQTSLSSQQLIKFSWQVADGMRYLSSRKIIHRDLAARNVLVGEGETCKVTDFGMARDVYQENVYEKKTKGRLPVKWTAYEALLFGRYTTKSDVWSFGVVLYEIFTIGGSPYPRTDGRKMADLLNRGYRMPKPSHVDEALYKIMQDCWQENPDDRPTFEYLRDELKEMENQHQRHINLGEYDKKLYENVEDLMF